MLRHTRPDDRRPDRHVDSEFLGHALALTAFSRTELQRLQVRLEPVLYLLLNYVSETVCFICGDRVYHPASGHSASAQAVLTHLPVDKLGYWKYNTLLFLPQ